MLKFYDRNKKELLYSPTNEELITEVFKEYIIIATTRPETMNGDTAIAVNPKDNRYKKFVNKNLYESLSAYGVGFHRHNSEIQQELNLSTRKKVNFTFTPHLSPMFRGILSTIYVELNNNSNFLKIIKALKTFYKNEYFIKILKPNSLLSTNDVINTNYCHISICKTKFKNKIIILSAIDNLIKGGAGQAVQNFNIYYNFHDNRGLK